MAYSYYSPVTIDNTKVSGTGSHTDYIFLYKTTDARLKTVANGGHVENGFDIAFYNNTSATTKYSHKIIHYDGTTGELIAWVKIPSVSTSVDTTFYIHYGDGTISSSQENVTTLFSGYSAVFDGDDTLTASLADSTSNGNDLGLGTGSYPQQAGKIYKSRYFNSTFLKRDDASCVNLEMGTSGITISAWVKKVSGTSTWEAIFNKGILAGGVSGGYGFYFYQGKPGFQLRNDNNSFYGGVETTVAYADSTWHYLVGTADRSTGITDGMKFYFDGSLVGTYDISSENGVNWDNLERLEIGSRSAIGAGGGEYLNLQNSYVESGKIQIGTQKSADLIATEYNNQNSPSTFYSLGTEQSSGGGSTFIPRVTMF